MGEIQSQRDAIIAAIEGFDGLAGIKVLPVVQAEDAFFLNTSKASQIFVAYGSPAPVGPGTSRGAGMQMSRETWRIASVSTSFRTPTEAQTQLNGTFDLIEYLRKGFNSTDIPGLLSRGKRLIWRGDDPFMAEGRLISGGSLGYISTYLAPERFM